MTRHLAKAHGIPNLCLAGGVALNCVGNGKVLRDGAFERIWIQPAAGDAGGAVGAALAAYHGHFERPRQPATGLDGMSGAYLGPEFSQQEIETRLQTAGARFDILSESAMIAATADRLAAGDAVGWFQGRMEFGPRALGARSILGDPRNPQMQKSLNLRIKYRESFRPFAPAVPEERVAEFFRRTEPHSPLSYTLEEAVRRGRMTLAELLAEVMPDEEARHAMLSRLGIRPEATQ
jgi:carbamoyltransferase